MNAGKINGDQKSPPTYEKKMKSLTINAQGLKIAPLKLGKVDEEPPKEDTDPQSEAPKQNDSVDYEKAMESASGDLD